MPDMDPRVLDAANDAVAALQTEVTRAGGVMKMMTTTHESIRSAGAAVEKSAGALGSLSDKLAELGREVAKLNPAAVAAQIESRMVEVARVRQAVETLRAATEALSKETNSATSEVRVIGDNLTRQVATVESLIRESVAVDARASRVAAEAAKANGGTAVERLAEAKEAIGKKASLAVVLSGIAAVASMGAVALLLLR